jgi:hypothetical protein
MQNVAAQTPAETAADPFKLQKRIGSTVYSVSAYFATNTSETLEDKILRLARNDGLDFQSVLLTIRQENAEPTRTGRLPERSGAV